MFVLYQNFLIDCYRLINLTKIVSFESYNMFGLLFLRNCFLLVSF